MPTANQSIKKRRPWTPKEVKTLKSLAKKKTPAGRIAKTLKRTEGATRQKALTISLSLNSHGTARNHR